MNNFKKWLLEIRSGMRSGNELVDVKLALEILDHTYDVADQELKNLMAECFELYRNDIIRNPTSKKCIECGKEISICGDYCHNCYNENENKKENNSWWNCPYCRTKCYYDKTHICGDGFKPTYGYFERK